MESFRHETHLTKLDCAFMIPIIPSRFTQSSMSLSTQCKSSSANDIEKSFCTIESSPSRYQQCVGKMVLLLLEIKSPAGVCT